MKNYSPESNIPNQLHGLQLDAFYQQVQDVILARQDPITGLLPASTTITIHGDYTDAWVRDNVYSILGVWGLAQAYRRQGNNPARAYQLEQSVVKLMRGLLTAMMKQADKVECFKQTQNPLEALHAKYDTRTGNPIAGDGDWGHLQLDATSLFLLMLAQMTRSGLRIVFTSDEVDFVQNLAHYLGRAYHTPDYGVWERGHKKNEGQAELNASSVGMAKAALEALQGFNLFGPHGGPDSVVHVMPDDIARARNTLESLLPRESNSKETDAALLSIIGFPAFAVEDADLVARTRTEIIDKLQGRYGCKRFLRDGHQTVVEDHDRLYYEAGELRLFQHIESEWPLFFTYLLLDGVLRENEVQAQDYRALLEGLLVERDGHRLLPELYYVPAENVEWEKLKPQSQVRLPNGNVPLVWAQSLYLLGVLLQEGFIEPADIDPLNRRHRVGHHRENQIQIALLAEDAMVRERLEAYDIPVETLEQIQPVQVRPAAELAVALGELGRNYKLDLSGRPPRPLGSLLTCQVFTGNNEQTLLFLPPFLNQRDFYLSLDNHLMVEQLKAELAYIQRHWDQSGQPLMTLLITNTMLRGGGYQVLLDFLKALRTDCCTDASVKVAKLSELLPSTAETRIDYLHDVRSHESVSPGRLENDLVLAWSQAATRPLGVAKAIAWREEPDNNRLLNGLTTSLNPFEQIELLELLWQRYGPEVTVEALGATIRELTEMVYTHAGETRLWGVVRWAAGLLEKTDDTLEEAVADIVVHQHQLAVGRAYSGEAVVGRPLSNAEIIERIRAFGGDDPRGRVLIQEIVLLLGMLIKADPRLLRGTFTLRPWHLLLLVTGELARERGINPGEAFEALLGLSPHALLERLHRVIINSGETGRNLAQLEALQPEGDIHALQRVRFFAHDNLQLAAKDDWRAWREANGILTRLPEDFFSRVWQILRHCRGLVIGDQLDTRNRLDSELIRADMTATEKDFALRVEHLLNNIQAPEYRLLSIEALLAVAEILEANPRLEVDSDLALDVLIGNAVYLAWGETHPEPTDGDYNEHCAEAWSAFYGKPPYEVANAIMASLGFLLDAAEPEIEVAA